MDGETRVEDESQDEDLRRATEKEEGRWVLPW